MRVLKTLCNNYDDDDEYFMSSEAFINWYGSDTDERYCRYCGVSESQINTLELKKEINMKRLSTRGKTLEIDRRESHKFYNQENIILSCYWCNNAKTDEFSLLDFKSIAHGINKVWKQRLNLNVTFPDSTYEKKDHD